LFNCLFAGCLRRLIQFQALVVYFVLMLFFIKCPSCLQPVDERYWPVIIVSVICGRGERSPDYWGLPPALPNENGQLRDPKSNSSWESPGSYSVQPGLLSTDRILTAKRWDVKAISYAQLLVCSYWFIPLSGHPRLRIAKWKIWSGGVQVIMPGPNIDIIAS